MKKANATHGTALGADPENFVSTSILIQADVVVMELLLYLCRVDPTLLILMLYM